MKKTLIASVAVLALVVGCSNKKKADPAVSSQGTLTDVAPPAPVANPSALPVNNAMPVTPVDPTPTEGHAAGAPVAGPK
ncbi:MAG TPA: hypothetical protein VHP11_10815, partial [Tepidisphaeraceae bacterium]|nr:hypothetical protein [Tepidisphaeraceae bacterium]